MPNIRLEAIKPTKLPTAQEYVNGMKKAAQKSADLTKRDLESTTRTWKHKPKFTVILEENATAFAIFAGTNDDIYHYVDEGTKPHIIKPKRSKYLRFLGGYQAKTRVGIIGSQNGGSSYDPVFAQVVHHPGTKARNFIITINKRRQKTMEQEIDHGLAKVARQVG